MVNGWFTVEASQFTGMCHLLHFLDKCTAELPATPFRHENRSRRQQRPCQSLPPACLRSWLEFNFAGIPAVKTAMFLVVGGVVSSYVGEVSKAVPAAYENQAFVEWNSKQSVSFLTCISAFSLRTFEHWTHHKLVYSRKPNSSCVGYSQLIFGPSSSWICLNLTLLTQLCIYLSFETWNVYGIKIQFNILGVRVFDFVPQQFSTIYEYLNGWRHVKQWKRVRRWRRVKICLTQRQPNDLWYKNCLSSHASAKLTPVGG